MSVTHTKSYNSLNEVFGIIHTIVVSMQVELTKYYKAPRQSKAHENSD